MTTVPAKFFILPAVQVLAILGFALGGGWTFLGGGVFIFLALVCDFIEDRSQVDELSDLGAPGRRLMAVIIGLHLVFLVAGIARAAAFDSWVSLIGTIVSLRPIASVASFTSHELCHSNRRIEREAGLFLFSLGGHPAIAIDHIHNHHRKVALPDDPLRARRGEAWARYIWRSIPAQYLGAWRFEQARLSKRGRSPWTWRNRLLRGGVYFAASLALVTMVFGPLGLLAALAAAISSIRGIEKFNYITHYGLMRAPGSRCEARHSWNSRLTISSGFTLNATGHSHHHVSPGHPFWKVTSDGALPILPFGPGLNSVLVGIPPVWTRIMAPRLAYWDQHFATPEERRLLRSLGEEVSEPRPHDSATGLPIAAS